MPALQEFMKRRCHDCQVQPGQPHQPGCDTEQCSVCGWQRLSCDCEGHDPAFARWSGFWPCKLEAQELELDLNQLAESGVHHVLMKKPQIGSDVPAAKNCPVCRLAMISPSGPFNGGTCSRECARAKVIADAAENLVAEIPALAVTIENLRLTLVEVR